MRKIFLIIGILSSLAAEAKPSFFKIANYRFSPDKELSSTTENGNTLSVILARSNSKHVSINIVQAPTCTTRFDFTDLKDQIVAGAEFDLTTSNEDGKVNIAFRLYPNGSEPISRASNSDSEIIDGKLTIIAVKGTKTIFSYSATILNYAEQVENGGVLETTTVESPIKVSGRYIADTANVLPELNPESP